MGRAFRGLIASCQLLVAAAPGLALEAETVALPGNRPVTDFELVDDRELEGADGEATESYYSAREVAYLVEATDLPLLLISPRGRSIQRVDPEKLSKDAGGVSLEAGAAVEPLGEYRDGYGGAMIFELDGKEYRLVKRPPMVGSHSREDVSKRHRRFAQEAKGYELSKRVSLRSLPIHGEETVVTVYFGSWSEYSERVVPKLMRVEDELAPLGVRFEYYGLPDPPSTDAVVQELGLNSYPTVVVRVDGEEIGRVSGLPLDHPEEALWEIFAHPSPGGEHRPERSLKRE